MSTVTVGTTEVYFVWALLAAAAVALWCMARVGGTATPVAVLRRLATGPLSRVALVLAWMWLGWHFFAR